MLPDTHAQRVLGLACQKGLLRACDLDAIDAPRVVLTRLPMRWMPTMPANGATTRRSFGWSAPSHPVCRHVAAAP